MRHLDQPEKTVVRGVNTDHRPSMIDPKSRAANSPAKAMQPANSDKDEFGDLG